MINGLIAQWFHCLIRFTHRSVTGYDKQGHIVLIACECGQVFWKQNN